MSENDDCRQREVKWCRDNGFNHRIRVNRDGVEYFIGDWSWNSSVERRPETLEPLMKRAGVYGK